MEAAFVGLLGILSGQFARYVGAAAFFGGIVAWYYSRDDDFLRPIVKVIIVVSIMIGAAPPRREALRRRDVGARPPEPLPGSDLRTPALPGLRAGNRNRP